MKYPSKEQMEELRALYPAGTRVRLQFMDDPQAVPPDTLGTVEGMDDAGQLSVRWDNGRRLRLVPGEDFFSVVEEGADEVSGSET